MKLVPTMTNQWLLYTINKWWSQ